VGNVAVVQWPLQEARQRFSELVRRAETIGPQVVTRHGQEIVVVLAAEEFHRLQTGLPDFKQFLMGAPELDTLDIRRDASPARAVELR
jgi:prevent-host-death family protein